MFTKKTMGVLAGIALIGTVLGVFGINEVRPWATPEEVRGVQRSLEMTQSDSREVSDDTYNFQLLKVAGIIATLQLQRDQCVASGGDCRLVIERLVGYEAEEARIKRRRDRFGT